MAESDQTRGPGENGQNAEAPIARVSLHDAIVNRLRDMIIEGVLEPGARIHETQIGAQLGVSRTPLREAIKFLASEGLIDLIPSRGAFVRKFTKKDVRDMMLVLKTLECLAAKLACANATDDEIRKIRVLHNSMMAHYRARRRLEYYKDNQSIHTELVRLCGNATLEYCHGTIQNRLKRIRFIGHEGETNWSKAVEEHEEIIDALEHRDEERLAAVVDRHLSEAWERVSGLI